MKVLFCYDGPIRTDDENNYYGIALNNAMLARYELISQDITMAIRVKKIKKEEKERYSQIDSEKYSIIACPDLSSLKGMLINKAKCKKILKETIKNMDIIVARLPSMIGSLAINIARKCNKPYLIELVGCPWDSFWNHSLKGKCIAPFMWYKTKKIVRNARYVAYVSNEFLQRRYPTKGKQLACSDVVLNEINENALIKRLDKINSKKTNDKIVLGTVAGVNVKYKGQQYVIKAISKLNKMGYNFEYQLAGAGDNSYLKNIAKRYHVEDKVKFLGSLPHNEVFSFLDNLDIYIQPSKQEGLCRALVEAISRACPCIASNAGGNPELISKDYIFKKGNYRQLITAMEKLNKDEMLEQAKINFETAKEYKMQLLNDKRNSFYKRYFCDK